MPYRGGSSSATNVTVIRFAELLDQLGDLRERVKEHVLYSSRYQDLAVRRAAIWAMVYTAWPEFKDALDRLARTDEDPQVAREAKLALEQLAESGGIEL